MIIKEINIRNFAGLKNKVLKFDEGLNLIYGENEKGKSRIQGFIKLWLYGIPKGDRVSREKYLSFSGEVMDGELRVLHNKTEYIIKRRFGISKKEDFLEVLNSLTGEKVNLNRKEVGEYFLDISEKIFTRTLFINQLGVEVVKDKKEDGIKERLQSLFITNNDEVSIEKAIEKLKGKRKETQNNRKNGVLDLINKKIDERVREHYSISEGIEKNLDIQLALKNEKKNKIEIINKIEKLEIYKKHIKKIWLKKDYEDIVKYFDKNKEIKKEEEKLSKELVKENIEITEKYLEAIENKMQEYLSIKDKLEEKNIHKENLLNSQCHLKRESNEFEVFISLGGNVKEKLMKINSEIEVFKEKLENEKKLYALIEEKEREVFFREKELKELKDLKDNKEEILWLIEKEKNLSEQTRKENGGFEKELLICSIVSILIGIGVGFLYKNYIISILLIIIGIGLQFFSYAKKNKENHNDRDVKEKLKEIKIKLKKYNYNEENMHIVEKFIKEEEKSNLIIEERLNRIEDLNLDDGRDRYNQNIKMINSILSMTGAKNIEDLYLKVDIYERIKNKIDNIRFDILNINREIDDLEFKINKLKKSIIHECINIKENIKIEEVLDIIGEYKDKLKRKKDLDVAMKNIEETYKALLKDRNIEEIKESLELSFNDEDISEYKKEEEIDEELKKYSQNLIESEKKIKVLEGEIKLSLKGFRDINIVEEELFDLKEKRGFLEKNLKAIDIAIEGLEKVDRDIKEKFAPEVNKYIGQIFNELTGGRYKKVILKEDYSLEIEGERWFESKFLSGGAKDQIYLALRLAFIKIIFKEVKTPIIFDEIFLQYDDIRREIAIKYLSDKIKNQKIIFTCQKIEEDILNKNKMSHNRIVI